MTDGFYILAVAIIKEILPVDSERPNVVTIVSLSTDGEVTQEVEFDTHESAAEWRREMQGQYSFMYTFDCMPTKTRNALEHRGIIPLPTKSGAKFVRAYR